MHRRRLLGAAAATFGLAGCVDVQTGADDDEDDSDPSVLVGPDGTDSFEPAEIEVDVGTTVEWTFESRGHNVVATSVPDGADWNGETDILAEGDSYEHTFEEPGIYEYVCEPHEGSGMVGEINVTDE